MRVRELLTLSGAPHPLRLAAAGAFGAAVGMALYVARVSEAASYLSDNPETCINCHIMFPQYATCRHSSHANVATCNDCHMPYKSQGGVKFTDHQIRSPLYNMESSCQVCHRWSEAEIRERVTSIQDKTRELRDIAEDALVRAHITLGDAAKHGATDRELGGPRETLRRAQMYWDYVAANNGMGFHAPQEAARVLAKATNLAQACQLETERVRARHGQLEPAPMPDLSTRAKARAYVAAFVAAR